MNISAPFIKRPIGTSLLTLALLMSGILAFNFLPVAPLPQVEFPVIQVSAGLPGASPETMASAVATPLERQFGRIAAVNQMTSSSQLGSTGIALQFDLNRNIDAAARDVQASINAARSQLPANLPSNPSYRKVNPADAPILLLGLTSNTMTVPQMYDAADSILAQKLSQVQGVGQVFVWGSSQPAVRAEVNPTLLNKLGVGLDNVRNALSAANANRPKGQVSDNSTSQTLDTTDQLFTADQYRPLIVAYNNGAAVRLGDVAEVTDSVSDVRNLGLINGKPGILLAIFRQPGANIIDTVDRVRALMPYLQFSISPAMTLSIVMDRTTSVRASVKDIERTLLISIALVIMVVFVFLRTVRATIIPSIAVPLSLVGTFGAMYVLGYSLDNLSLMALAISTGFVVDDAIVMIENISRYIEQGEPPMQAALKGAGQIGFTIISLTVSLIAVLIPLLFMGDVVGRLFHEFAITLAVTIVISAVVSLTLVPMMCAKLLRHTPPKESHRFEAKAHQFIDYVIARYAVALTWVLNRQRATLFVALLTLVLTALLYVVIPKGFFPVQDTGVIQAITQAPQSVSYASMAERQQELAAQILKNPDVESLTSFIGVDGSNITLNSGRMLINLKPRDDRSNTASDVIRQLQQDVAHIPGASLYMQPVQDLTIDSTVSPTQYQFMLTDPNISEFTTWVPKLVERLKQSPELADVATDLQENGQSVFIEIDRPTAARYGITPATIDSALYDAFGQRIISTIFTQSNQYRVILEALPQMQHYTESLNSIYLPSATSTGGQVPLSAIASFHEQPAPLLVTHLSQFPATTVSFNLAPGASLGAAVKAIGQAEKDIGLPASFQTRFQGAALAFQASLANELFLILAAIVTMYIVLGVLYESFIHPITILSTLPSAGVGALLALLITGHDLDIIGIIGIVLLIGIVKKNAIMMIDFALYAEREEGKPPREAIYQACLLRFRPILMTTLAALFGALPLMLGTGVGSELRHPLGITIVGGMIVSQVLTLFTTPVIYLAFDRLALRVRKRFGSHDEPEEVPA